MSDAKVGAIVDVAVWKDSEASIGEEGSEQEEGSSSGAVYWYWRDELAEGVESNDEEGGRSL
jgi:hypothetical protein